MAVTEHQRAWSNHALLHLVITDSALLFGSGPIASATVIKVHVPIGDGPRDILLQKTLHKCQSQEEASTSLFRLVTVISANKAKVHTDGACLKPGTTKARAGGGVLWGPGDSRNMSFRVAGPQTNNCAELSAVLHTILQAYPSVSLQLFTNSQYAIHSIYHWSPSWASMGWCCANANLLKDIMCIISR